jgi:hypothetical protein
MREQTTGSTKPPPSLAKHVAPIGTPAYVIALGSWMTVRLAAYSVVLLFLAAGVFSALTQRTGSAQLPSNWVTPVLYLVVYLATIITHELIHGLGFRLFGGRPRYGAGIKYFLPYLYATAPDHAFALGAMITIALAPLFVLSALALVVALLVPAWVGYLAVVFIGNTVGAIGDIWMTSYLIRFRRLQAVTVVDLADGMAIYTPDPRASEIAAKLARHDERSPGFVVHWMGATVALFAAEFLAGLIGPFFTDSLLIGPPQLPLVAFTNSDAGFQWTFGVASPLLTGLLFALAARLFARRPSVETS